jgi:hypothetical protein
MGLKVVMVEYCSDIVFVMIYGDLVLKKGVKLVCSVVVI